jgi:hypothetical protein
VFAVMLGSIKTGGSSNVLLQDITASPATNVAIRLMYPKNDFFII